MKEFFLTSSRIGFSIWNREDLKDAFELWGSPEVTKYITASGKMSAEQVRERLEQEIDNYIKFKIQYWPIFLRETGEHVGCCGLRPYDSSKNILEMGIHLKQAHWGKGLAEEACSAVLVYAFNELHADAVFAGHNPNNHASARLLKKLGFSYTHDEFYAPTGLYHPSYLIGFRTSKDKSSKQDGYKWLIRHLFKEKNKDFIVEIDSNKYKIRVMTKPITNRVMILVNDEVIIEDKKAFETEDLYYPLNIHNKEVVVKLVDGAFYSGIDIYLNSISIITGQSIEKEKLELEEQLKNGPFKYLFKHYWSITKIALIVFVFLNVSTILDFIKGKTAFANSSPLLADIFYGASSILIAAIIQLLRWFEEKRKLKNWGKNIRETKVVGE